MLLLYMTCMRVKPTNLEGRNKCPMRAREKFPLWCAVVSTVGSWMSLNYLGAAIVQKIVWEWISETACQLLGRI